MIPLLLLGYKSITLCIVITITNLIILLSNYLYCKKKLNINIKYQGFWKYVDRYSIDRVSDRDRYYVKAKLIGNKYMDCQIIKDNSKQEKERIIMSKIFDKEAVKYMASLKKKDIKRMQERQDIQEFDNKDSSET